MVTSVFPTAPKSALSHERLINSELGSVTLMVAVAAFVMVMAVGTAVDLSNANAVKSKVDSALDAANLAAGNAAMNIPCNVTTQAQVQDWVQSQGTKFFNANFSGGELGSSPITPTFTLSADGSSVLASATTNMSTPFLQIAGTDYEQINSCSQVSIPINGNLGTSATNTSPHVAGDPTTGLFTPGAGDVSIATNGVERLRVDGSGSLNVGPNTGVVTSSKVTVTSDGTGSDNSAFSLLNGNKNFWTIWNAEGTNPSATDRSNDTLNFEYNADASSKDGHTDILALNKNGNVGIGINIPNGNLDIEPNATQAAAGAPATLCLNGNCVSSLAAPDMIDCSITTTPTPIGANEIAPHNYTFTADNCGGTLPDAHYVGVFAATEVCGADESWVIVQPKAGRVPGVWFWTVGNCGALPSDPAASAAQIEVVFFRRVGTAATQIPAW